jgi:hypothetical protein
MMTMLKNDNKGKKIQIMIMKNCIQKCFVKIIIFFCKPHRQLLGDLVGVTQQLFPGVDNLIPYRLAPALEPHSQPPSPSPASKPPPQHAPLGL